MKAIFSFFKTTLVGGFLFLLPIILAVLALREAVDWLSKVLQPAANFLARHDIVEPRREYVLSILLIVTAGFLAGLIGRTTVGRRLRKELENLILRKMPGYTLLRGLTGEEKSGPKRNFRAGLVRLAPRKFQLCFVVERHRDGWLTIFIPSAPNPTSGTVQMISADQVVEMETSATEAVRCIMKIGEGFEAIAPSEAKHGAE